MPTDVRLGRFFRTYRGDRQFQNNDDDKESSSVVVYASCSIGEMADWLKANPTFSMDDFLWKISVPFARILSADQTHIIYLSKEEAKKAKTVKTAQRIDDPMQLMTDTGVPVFNKDNNE